jgi:outer membrane lipoprotein LolB
LNGCAVVSQKPLEQYDFSAMQHLQQQKKWSLEGRLALANDKESVSLSISWQHDPLQDDLDLVGPLGQGRVKIIVTQNQVVVDDGETRRVFDGKADLIISEQLGVDLPIQSLRYWVLGTNDPDQSFTEQPEGFYQAGWLVRYRELQDVSAERLPKKMTAEKDKSRIKLIVDQWVLS